MQARTGRQKQETAQAEFQMTFPGVGTESLQLLLAASRPGHQFIKQHCMGRSLLNAMEFQRKKKPHSNRASGELWAVLNPSGKCS